jgi:hypothetical protein
LVRMESTHRGFLRGKNNFLRNSIDSEESKRIEIEVENKWAEQNNRKYRIGGHNEHKHPESESESESEKAKWTNCEEVTYDWGSSNALTEGLSGTSSAVALIDKEEEEDRERREKERERLEALDAIKADIVWREQLRKAAAAPRLSEECRQSQIQALKDEIIEKERVRKEKSEKENKEFEMEENKIRQEQELEAEKALLEESRSKSEGKSDEGFKLRIVMDEGSVEGERGNDRDPNPDTPSKLLDRQFSRGLLFETDSYYRNESKESFENQTKLDDMRREGDKIENDEKVSVPKIRVETRKRENDAIDWKKKIESEMIHALNTRAVASEIEKKEMEDIDRKNRSEDESLVKLETEKKNREEKEKRNFLEKKRIAQIESEKIRREGNERKIREDKDRVIKSECDMRAREEASRVLKVTTDFKKCGMKPSLYPA